jgi:hypothetical protein
MTTSFSTERPGLSGERYDLADYINPRALEALSGQRYDAATTAFFLRDLTEVMGRTFDVKYPDLKARQILPVFTGVDPGAEGYVWRQYDRVGAAKVIDSYGADLPESEVVAAEFQSRCLSIGTSYSYSIQDLRKARMAGIPLETRKALAARRSMEQALEQIAFYGLAQIPGATSSQAMQFVPASQSTSDPMAMYGFTNFPGLLVPTHTLNTWTSSATAIANIVSDFNGAFLTIINNSFGVHTPDTVVFPLSTWASLASTARSITFTEDTVLQYLMKENPWLKNVYWSLMLETAGLKQDGATVGTRVMFCERNEENFQLVIPQEFEQLPPQMVNLMFKIPCHMRVGGIRVSYPKSCLGLDGTNG